MVTAISNLSSIGCIIPIINGAVTDDFPNKYVQAPNCELVCVGGSPCLVQLKGRIDVAFIPL